MGDIIGSGAQDLSQLVGERGRVAEDESVRLFQILQYVMENLIYHITEIMVRDGYFAWVGLCFQMKNIFFK